MDTTAGEDREDDLSLEACKQSHRVVSRFARVLVCLSNYACLATCKCYHLVSVWTSLHCLPPGDSATGASHPAFTMLNRGESHALKF